MSKLENKDKTHVQLLKEIDLLNGKIAELEKNNAIFRMIAENTSDNIGITTFDLKAKYTYVSPSVKTVLDYDPEDLIGKSFFDFIHPGDKKVLIPLLKKYINLKIKKLFIGKELPIDETIEFRFKNKAGNWHFMQSTLNVVGNQILAVTRDITESRQAERALKESEEKYRNIYTSANDAIFLVHNYTFIACNPKTLEMYGCMEDEIIGYTPIDFSPEYQPDGRLSREKALEKMNEAFDSKPQFFEWVHQRKDGSLFNAEVSLNKIRISDGEYIQAIVRDITNRKNAEKALKESEEKYRLMTTNTLDVIWTTDIEFNMTFVNSAIFDFLGYTPEEFIGLNRSVFVTEEGIKVIQNAAELLVGKYKEGEIIQSRFEIQQIRKDGSLIDVENMANTLLDKEGKLIGFQGRSVDITERKKADKKLKESEDRFEAFMNYMPAGIFIKDSDGQYLFSNKFNNDRFDINNIEGKTVYDFFLKEIADKFTEDDKKILKGENLVIEGSVNDKEGKLFYYKNHQFAIEQSDGKKLIGGISFDITKEKKAEKELTKLSTAVTQSPSIIVITNLVGILEYVNPKFTELTGYIDKEAIGQSSSLLKSGEQPDEIYSELWETIKSGSEWRGEFHNRKKNGELFWEAAIISPIFDKQGEIINYLKVAEDITERKKKEQELVIALEKATESDRLKTAFLNNFSHEIRTPMNGILGFVDLLKKPNLTGTEQQNYIKVIESSSDRMLVTVDDLVNISMIESGQMKVSLSDINIIEQTENIYSLLKLEAEKKGLKLVLKNSLSADEAHINSDRTKIYGILTNFVKNAIKFTHKGSIEIGLNKKSNTLEFYVIDTGIGIPKDRQKAIFDRFVKADIEDKAVFEGSGLGLSIAKSFVEMLGGNLWLESEEGIGSKFYFTIPYNPVKKELAKSKVNKPRMKSGSLSNPLTILIVEDEEVSAEYLSVILSETDATLLLSKTGEETIETVRNNPDINIILMDIKMPGMNGYEATRQIRTFNNEVIIIAQTAYALKGDREKAIDVGCNDYIAKPINKDVLFELIASWT